MNIYPIREGESFVECYYKHIGFIAEYSSQVIRDCYLNLTYYLMNKIRTQNPNFKNDNFTDNLEEFLRILLPEKQSETRRNVINSIAQKGWKLNSELIHKDSTTVFDVLISFNICQYCQTSFNVSLNEIIKEI